MDTTDPAPAPVASKKGKRYFGLYLLVGGRKPYTIWNPIYCKDSWRDSASVVASLPLTSPLITPSTGEAEPRGSSCVLYDTYNTFCTIHIRNVSNGTNEWASVVWGKVQVVQSIFLLFPLSVYPWREDPTSEKTPP